jgi:acyl-CoA dehydrogenase
VPQAARAVCEGAIQIHGGLGFTWEQGLHLGYRRVLQIQAAFGGPSATAHASGRAYLDAIAARTSDGLTRP